MADFSVLPLGPTVQLLGEAGKGAKLEHNQIANNIANVNTPEFRSSYVDFRSALQDSLGTPPDPDELPMAVEVDTTTQMRVDGSNVDIDQQMAQLSENTGYQQTVSQLLQEQYKFIREASTEQPT
jgi:flagellar basal-body rod protein FlgB